jgi:4-amino-4-deoxy-L-arabinose transferase-like glycosyltransferase
VSSAAPRRDAGAAFVVVTVAAVVRLVFAALIPLFPDETYYWEWSRHLAAGYFDHPPGIALLIRAGDAIASLFGLGFTPLGVRLGAVIAGWIASIATVGIARELGGSRGAWRAAWIMTVVPLAAAGLLLATPDSPVLAATAVCLYCVVRALGTEVASRASLSWWTLAGMALGVAFASKYTSIFVPAAVVAAIVLRADLRVRLREPGPYVACVVATLVFIPVLIWNARHDWISFVFQLRHGLAAPNGSALLAAWKHEGDLLGGQAGLASPIVFVMLCIAVARGLARPVDGSRFVLAVVALVSFGFFVYSAIRQRVEPNWPAAAYIPAIPLLAVTAWQRVGERWLRAGLWLAAVLSAVIYVQGLVPVLPVPPPRDPIGRAFGWREMARHADSVAATVTRATSRPTWLGGDRYQEASELAFQMPSHPTTFATNLSGRVNQYALWPGFADRAGVGDNLLLVLDESDDQPGPVRALVPFFGAVQRGDSVLLRRGAGVVARRRVWVLTGWRGGWPRR